MTRENAGKPARDKGKLDPVEDRSEIENPELLESPDDFASLDDFESSDEMEIPEEKHIASNQRLPKDSPYDAIDRQWPMDAFEPFEEVSLEELEEQEYEARLALDADGLVDTAHTDGSTTNPQEAVEQGLVYTPPEDPPVVPSDDLQGVEIAAGFASSMEESNLDVSDLPDHVDNQDLDLEEDIATALRYNSETTNLTNIRLSVRDGIVFLAGTVESDDDIAVVDYLVRDIEGVRDVRNNLEVEGL
jgi:hypothetical protein